jgi:protein gp37
VGGPCYAGNFHERRLAKSLPDLYAPSFTEVRLVPGRMAKSAAWSDLRGKDRPDKPWLNGMPRTIFVGDMGDIFSRDVPFEYLERELINVATSKNGQRHIWMVLTKQAGRLAQFAAWLTDRGIAWPANVWAGVSVTRRSTLTRLNFLRQVPAAVRFASHEPGLERVDWERVYGGNPSMNLNVLNWLDWLIVGGESDQGRDKARPFDVDWIRSTLRQCRAHRTRLFVKQLGSNVRDGANRVQFEDSHGGDWVEWDPEFRVREMPDAWKGASAW